MRFQCTLDDWIECFDPKNRRCYYHSASLGRSTWHKPARYVPLSHHAAAALKGAITSPNKVPSSRASSRSGTPSSHSDRNWNAHEPGKYEGHVDDSGRILSTTPTYAHMQAHNEQYHTYVEPQQRPQVEHVRQRQRSDSGSVVSIRSSSAASSIYPSLSPFLSTAAEVANRGAAAQPQQNRSISSKVALNRPHSQSPTPLQQHRRIFHNQSHRNSPTSPSSGSVSAASSLSRSNSNNSLSYSSVSSVGMQSHGQQPRSSSATRSLWASAVDPVSQRVYWYNR
jgi:hypothetical protein